MKIIKKIKNGNFEYILKITKEGFALWVLKNKGEKAVHWLIDASTLKETNSFLLAKDLEFWGFNLKQTEFPYYRKFEIVKI
jgi:hypothetical protein